MADSELFPVDGGKAMTIKQIGIDIGKTSFHLIDLDAEA